MRTGHLDVAKALNESDNNVAAGTTPELWDVSRSSRYHTWDLDFECPSYMATRFRFSLIRSSYSL